MFFVILFVSFFIGVFGWAQIIGSLQNIAVRGLGMTLFTIVIWAAILGGAAYGALQFFPAMSTALLVGYGVSFVIILFSGRIQ